MAMPRWLGLSRFRRERCPECGRRVRQQYCDACGYDLITKTRDKAINDR